MRHGRCLRRGDMNWDQIRSRRLGELLRSRLAPPSEDLTRSQPMLARNIRYLRASRRRLRNDHGPVVWRPMTSQLAVRQNLNPHQPADLNTQYQGHMLPQSNQSIKAVLAKGTLRELPALTRRRTTMTRKRGGLVCLNRFSGLISGIPAVVMKMMDPRSELDPGFRTIG